MQSLEESSAIQDALKSIMQAVGRELGEFERLIVEDRDLATQVLFASVGALTNLQASRAVRGELNRRQQLPGRRLLFIVLADLSAVVRRESPLGYT